MLYCDYRDQIQQTSSNLLGAIIKQLLAYLEPLPADILDIYQRNRREGNGLGFVDAKTMLASALTYFGRVYVCIDALDECSSRAMGELLKGFHSSMANSTRLFMTGRLHVRAYIEQYLEIDTSPEPAAPITIVADLGDIRKFLENEIDNYDPEPQTMNDALRGEILDAIPAKSDGM